MDSARTLLRKISALFRRERFQDELAQEVAFHREQIEAQLREEGVPAQAAQAAASRQFRNELRIREKSVERVEFRFETTVQDIRYGIRQLRNNPGFATTAILILGLGIGATTAIFSAVNPILFKSLPY